MGKLGFMRPYRAIRLILIVSGILAAATALYVLACAQEELRRNPGPIVRPKKLPSGKLIGDNLYCSVLPGNLINRNEPTVDWEYGLWKYSLQSRRAELLIPFERYAWLENASVPDILPDGSLGLQLLQDPNSDFREDLNQMIFLSPSDGHILKTVQLSAYKFEQFGMWGCMHFHGEQVTLQHPTLFKVLALQAVINEEDSDYVVEISLYGGKDIGKRQWSNYDLFPLKLADDGVSPFLVLDDEFFGFRILDREGRLLYQGGQVVPSSFLSGPTSILPEGLRMADLLSMFYPPRMAMVVYMHVGWPGMTEENLIVFYDQYLECIFVCSPLGDFYKKIDRPEDTWKKHIVGAGLTGEDGYMLLFEDGSTFIANYSDIAEQVRAGKLDPLGPLRDLMGMEMEEE